MIVSMFSIVLLDGFLSKPVGLRPSSLTRKRTDTWSSKPFPGGRPSPSCPLARGDLALPGRGQEPGDRRTNGSRLSHPDLDETGKKVVDQVADQDEDKLTDQAKKEIQAFEKTLQKSWSLKGLTPAIKQEILSTAISLCNEPTGKPALSLSGTQILSFVRDNDSPDDGKDLVVVAK